MKCETKYIVCLTTLYFLLSFIGILHHELWLDESHHWLISRDSTSFVNLIANTRYEGHPILWNILLFWITRITLDPFFMQLLHIVISALAVLVFLRKAPFGFIFKSLFIFGYFMFFEYNIISRNYAIGVLFLFIACAIFKNRKTHFTWFCLILAAAANIHLMFAIIAFALLLTVIFENFRSLKIQKRSFIIGLLLFVAGVAVLALQVIPPQDSAFFVRVSEIPLSEKFTKGFIALFKGLATVPDFRTIHFWNSNLLVNLSKPVTAVLGLLAYGLPLVLFRKKATLFFTYSALAGVQIFFYVLQLGAARYDGMTFLIIVVALWIDSDLPEDEFQCSRFFRLSSIDIRRPIVYSLLLLQFFSGITAYSYDFRFPFTTAKEAIGYAQSNNLNQADIVTITCDGTLISPYLHKKVWFLCEGDEESYCHWYRICANNIEQATIQSMLGDYMDSRDYAVYISYYPITAGRSHEWVDINHRYKIRFRKKTGESIVRNNSLYIYEVAKSDTADAE